MDENNLNDDKASSLIPDIEINELDGDALIENAKEIWKRITTFIILTYSISSIFIYLSISAGDLGAAGGLYGLGGMWSPGIAAILTQLLYRKSIRDFGWGWGKTKYQLWSYAIPVLYCFVIYIFVWVTGSGALHESYIGIIGSIALRFPIWIFLVCFATLGEEIGWSGLFAPQLIKVTSYTKVSFLRGIVWSVWHYPLIIWGVYGSKTLPIWFKLICFTIVLTGTSFAYTWLRFKSGSLWTGMFLHAAHNMFIQSIFPRLTVDTGMTAYFIDEFGIVSAIVAVLVAFIFWTKQDQLDLEHFNIRKIEKI